MPGIKKETRYTVVSTSPFDFVASTACDKTHEKAISMPATYTFKFVNVQPTRLRRTTLLPGVFSRGNFLAIGSEWFHYTRISMRLCDARDGILPLREIRSTICVLSSHTSMWLVQLARNTVSDTRI